MTEQVVRCKRIRKRDLSFLTTSPLRRKTSNSANSAMCTMNMNRQFVQKMAMLIGNSSAVDEITELEIQKFSLPKFQGEYEKWFKFQNTFGSPLIRNSKFNNAKKRRIEATDKIFFGNQKKTV